MGKQPSLDQEVMDRQRLKRTAPKDLHLGRYPFSGGIRYYEAKRSTKYSRSTMEENVRKLRMFARIFEEMKKNGLVRTTDPRCIDSYDIEAFLDYMKERRLGMNTKVKYTNVLESYLVTFNNYTIGEMKRTADWPLARDETGEIFSLELSEVQRIFDALDEYEPKSVKKLWHKIVLSGVFSIMFGTAIRPKEIFQAKVKDIHLEEGKNAFYVEHPKGEDSWGKREWIPIIRGDMVERIKIFLNERAQFIKAYQLPDSQYLFINFSTGQPFTGQAIRKMKSEIEKLSGVKFKLKDFRATYATLTAENDMDRLKNVSVQLRHKSVETTEGYYLRLRRMKAQKKIADVWEETAIVDSKKKRKDEEEGGEDE